MEKLFSPWRSKYIASFAEEASTANSKCVFCDAYAMRQDPASLVVYSGAEAFVVMNKFPYNSGHLMVIPIRHTGEFESLSESEHAEMMYLLTASKRALTDLFHPHGFNLGMNLGRTAGAGIEGHLHWHIVPRWNGDTNFMPILNDVKVVSEDMAEQWKRLADEFSRL